MPSDPFCTRCPLHSGVRSVCIEGRWRQWGDAPAAKPRVMLVGEAPGYHEDVKGAPFVGASGDLLDRAMRAVGLGSAFLTNAVRCFPDGTLPRKSIGLCADYLDEEIAQQRPQYILALGAVAFHRLGGRGSITEMAGKPFYSEHYQCWIMPALHPAAILRAMGRYDSWLADLAYFAQLVKGGQPELPPLGVWRIEDVTSMNALYTMLKSGTPFAYDFEATTHPIWHRDWKPYTVAFYFEGATTAHVLPLLHPESPWNLGPWTASGALTSFFAEVQGVMQDPDRVKVTWSDTYDAVAWRRVAGYSPHTTCDAMALRHLLDENRPKNLKWNGQTVLGWPNWDIDATKPHPLDELAKYNAYDAYATWLLREQLLPQLDERQRHYFGSLVMPSIRAVGRLMARGIYVDKDVLNERIAQCRENMQAVASTIPVSNPGSRDQIADWLYKDNHLPVLSTTPTGKPSTDEQTINLLARRYPPAKRVLEYRKWSKYDSTYLAYADELVTTSVDSRAHFEFKSTSVETGRWGSRFHTQPRAPFVRSIFTSPTGWVTLSADYCLHPSTLVETTQGKKRIGDIKPGDKVFTLRDRKIAWGEVTASQYIRSLPACRVWLDNGDSIVASTDHRWLVKKLRREGKAQKLEIETLRTEELEPGMSLVPMYRTYAAGRTHLYAYSNREYAKEHVIVAEAEFGPCPPGYDVHHKDENPSNNYPDNLEYKEAHAHRSEHSKKNWPLQDHESRLVALRQGLKQRRSYDGEGNPNFGKRYVPRNACLRCGAPDLPPPKKYCSRECYAVARRDGLNHTVVAIDSIGVQPMWAITVEPDHNYVLAAGVVTCNSQIEARLAAWKAAGKPRSWEEVDPSRAAMLLAFRDGRDVYVETAAAVLRKEPAEITREGPDSERQIMGKVPSLAMIYRISPQGFREYAWSEYEIVYSETEAKHLHQAFYTRWPEIAAWHRHEERLIKATGVAHGLLGRDRHLPEVFGTDRAAVEAAVRSGINAPVQGGASNVLDAVLITADQLLDPDVAFATGIVHDNLLLQCREDAVPQVGAWLQRQMTVDVPRALQSFDLYLPPGLLQVEIFAGPWGAHDHKLTFPDMLCENGTVTRESAP